MKYFIFSSRDKKIKGKRVSILETDTKLVAEMKFESNSV